MAIEDRQYPISFKCPAREGTITTSANPRRIGENDDISVACSICKPTREPSRFTANILSDLQTTISPELVQIAIHGYCHNTLTEGEKVQVTTHL